MLLNREVSNGIKAKKIAVTPPIMNNVLHVVS
jgi:hypothetical protein